MSYHSRWLIARLCIDRLSSIKLGVSYKAEDHGCCNVRPRSSAYGYPYCPHGSRGPIWLCPSCYKSFRAYNNDVGYDSQIVTSGGGVTRQTAEEGVGQVT